MILDGELTFQSDQASLCRAPCLASLARGHGELALARMARSLRRLVLTLASCGLVGAPVATAVPVAATACHVAVVDAMFKIRPELPPSRPFTAYLGAALGENVHLQVVVTGAAAEATAAAGGSSPAVMVDGLSPSDVQLRVVAYHNLSLTLAPKTNSPGLYGDALLPLSASSSATAGLAPGAVAPRVYWVTISVPRDASPGLHAGSFRLASCPTASFTLKVASFTLPATPTQLTGAQFEPLDIAAFSSDGTSYTPETAYNWFKSLAAQRINSQVWFQLDGLPWAPSYTFNEGKTAVSLNTTLNDVWWPKVLKLTGSRNFRMPFSLRITKGEGAISHHFPTNCTWWFNVKTSSSSSSSSSKGHSSVHKVPMFSAEGVVSPEFARMFKLLFGAVSDYLESKGWAEEGSWVQVTDEPTWTDNATLANSIALMKLYKEVSPKIKIYQTRFPQGGGSSSSSDSNAADVGSEMGAGVLPGTEPLMDLVDCERRMIIHNNIIISLCKYIYIIS